MQYNDLFNDVERILPPDESAQVFAALRQDALVWRSLERADFFQMAVERLGGQAQRWNPGQLALLALGENRPAEVLRMEPLPVPEQVLQERALQAYQLIQHGGTPPATLAEAGLLALALRERRRLTGTWSGLLQEIVSGASGHKPGALRPVQTGMGELFNTWRTALACLYSLVPDPEEMLRGLLPRNFTHISFEWIAHVQLSQPVREAEHVGVFSRVLQGLPVPYQLTLLRGLNLHGRERMAATLAGNLVVGHPAFVSLRSQTNPNERNLAGLSSRALALQQMGAFYQLAGDADQALSLYSAAEATLNQWRAGLYLQRLDLEVGEGAGTPEILMENESMDHLAAAAGWLKDELGVVLLSHPRANNLMERVEDGADGAFLQLKRSRQMFQTEPALGRDLALQSVAGMLETIRQQAMPFHGDFVYNWRPEDALGILLEMGLPDEAARLAQALLEIRPIDIALLHLASRIQERLGNLELAIRYARDMTALDPGSTLGHRLLGSLWGQAGAWEKALAEWQEVLALSGQPAVVDRLSAARAALQAGQPDQAGRLCETILLEETNNGPALGILGQALVARGDSSQAAGYLVRATLLSPEILEPWLALARVQTEQGEPRRALETLRAAVTAVPDDPEGHQALGEACVAGGLLAEALPHLKKAFTLSGNSPKCALLYGRTLRMLGHSGEARATLEKVRPSWTAFPELAYEYAQVLLDLNDAESALPVLETALRNGLPVLEASLLYARILLGEYHAADEKGQPADWDAETRDVRLQQACQAMERILEVAPDNLEARFLMADILREKGALEEALEAYRALAELPVADVPELCWRIQWGLGRTALLLGQADTALAALKEACQARPDSLPILRSLAEVSLRANLQQEALEVAANVLRLAPDDLETLAWFADFVTRAGEPRRAVEALERAVQLDPDRADLLVNLASGQASAGDLAAARANLEKVMALANTGQDAVSQADLRRAAHVYLRLEDPRLALACYERALQAEASDGNTAETTAAGLLFEVAQLQERMGNHEAALGLTQQALDCGQESLPMHLLQADLLTRLNRPQAALAVLERALRLAQSGLGSGSDEGCAAELGGIHDRFTRLMMQSGDLPAALHHAEKCLEYQSTNAALCYRAADLALALLQNDRARGIIASFQTGEGGLPAVLSEQGRDGLNLLSLQVELALDEDQDDLAAGWIEAGLNAVPGEPRLVAAKARLLARQGDLASARRYVSSLISARDALWLAEAAQEVHLWKDVPGLFGNYAQSHPGEARAHLKLARALVLCAEQQRLCEAAGCRRNAPGPAAVSEESCQKFEQAIQQAGQLVNAGEIGRWQARGRAVFAPNAQAARALTSIICQPDDIAALVAALRRLNNRTAAIQVARRYAEHPLVLLQLALCYQEDPSNEGLAVAGRAVSANPRQPLAHAVLAMLSRKAGEISDAQESALEAYETALLLWPDEPTWHEAAGDLCLQVGNVKSGILHYQQALVLEPENARFAFKLGQASLADEDISGAIGCLEKSAALDPDQADVWLTLATAYHMADRLPQALDAARKASELNASSAEALLIAGETALSMNQTDQALAFAQGAVRREPENAGAVLFLSNVLVYRGRVEDGLAIIEQACPAVKSFFPVAFERARLIRRLHGPQAAVEVLEKLAKEYPEEPELLGFLARTQAECGDGKSAERYAFRALRLDPNQPDLTLMLARLNRKNGHLDQAVHLLGEVIRMVPDNLEAYLELGSVYQERREYGLALQTYRQALHVAPGDYQAYYQCGLILRDSKDYAGAENMLRRAAELAPDNAGQVGLSIRRQLVAVIALNLVHNKQEVTLS